MYILVYFMLKQKTTATTHIVSMHTWLLFSHYVIHPLPSIIKENMCQSKNRCCLDFFLVIVDLLLNKDFDNKLFSCDKPLLSLEFEKLEAPLSYSLTSNAYHWLHHLQNLLVTTLERMVIITQCQQKITTTLSTECCLN